MTTTVRARVGRFRPMGVDVSGALNLVGRMVKYFSFAYAFPVVLGLGYGDPIWPFLAAGVLTGGVRLGSRAGHDRRSARSVHERGSSS